MPAATARLRNERDLLTALEQGSYTLPELYQAARQAGLHDRVVTGPGGRSRSGRDRTGDGQATYKRRIRSTLAALARAGHAHRSEPGVWVIEGTREAPKRAVLIVLSGMGDDVELLLGDAADVLAQAPEPVDLIVADPPWALRRDRGTSSYGRDAGKVVGGYRDVDPRAYTEFLRRWMTVAGDVLRPGAYLAVVTGPQQSARVQVIAEDDVGLTYVNSISVRRVMGVLATRRFVHSHARITLMTKGPLAAPEQRFAVPEGSPVGRTGSKYQTDLWGWTRGPDGPVDDLAVTEVAARRRGSLRYDNALPVEMVRRLLLATTTEGDLVADPFVGSGTTAAACLAARRRFFGGDANPNAVRFTMGRLLTESTPGHLPS